MLKDTLKYFEPKALQLNPPATPGQIEEAENRIGRPFPNPLREFLLIHNGMVVADAVILGVEPQVGRPDIITATRDAKKHEDWEEWHLQVGGDSAGNLYYVDLKEQREEAYPVCIYLPRVNKRCVLASDYARFLLFRIESRMQRAEPDGTPKKAQAPRGMPWPLDTAYVLRNDPWIQRWPDRGFAWDLSESDFSMD